MNLGRYPGSKWLEPLTANLFSFGSPFSDTDLLRFVFRLPPLLASPTSNHEAPNPQQGWLSEHQAVYSVSHPALKITRGFCRCHFLRSRDYTCQSRFIVSVINTHKGLFQVYSLWEDRNEVSVGLCHWEMLSDDVFLQHFRRLVAILDAFL